MTVSSKKVLFLADPWETLDHASDSTLCLAKSVIQRFKFTAHWADPEGIFYENGRFYVNTAGFLQVAGDSVNLLPVTEKLDLEKLHSVHWRKDPPVSLSTLRTWTLLSNASSKIKFYNSPQALLRWNEKFSSLRFKSAITDTCVTNNVNVALTFAKKYDSVLLKPSSEAASRGVAFFPKEAGAARQTFLEVQKQSGPWLVLQKYDPAILKHGETRIFLMGGKIVGSLLKRARPGNPMMSFDTPSAQQPTLEATKLTSVQKKIASEIGQAMKKEGLFFATVDLIQNKVLEINVTSPGLLDWHAKHVESKKPLYDKYWDLIL